MAALTGKRKRETNVENHLPKKAVAYGDLNENGKTNSHVENNSSEDAISIQIVTGSYEKVLHGIHATIPSKSSKQAGPLDVANDTVKFSDTFLFAPHTASIRCLALSPPAEESGKRMLATGGSDERINLYSLSNAPPAKKQKLSLPTLEGITTAENPANRSLGNLIHHDRPITRLQFLTRSKLFSAAEDNNIAITRSRDWTVLSSIKAPVPKPQGRPSGDTAAPGEVPAGINDFAIHPSQKLMLSVGRGEKCMRLWNLMTGKKAGVLNFDRELLSQVGEGKYGSGEGRRVVWSESGESFVIAFERAAVLYGSDSVAKAIVRPSPTTKVHQIRFLPHIEGLDTRDVLAVSTEDGRILFYDAQWDPNHMDIQSVFPCPMLAELGGKRAGISGRIKDLEILPLAHISGDSGPTFVVVTASSDGAIRLWTVSAKELNVNLRSEMGGARDDHSTANGNSVTVNHVGSLIGTLETGNRITCLSAFVMDGESKAEVEIADEVEPGGQDDSESESSSASSDGA